MHQVVDPETTELDPETRAAVDEVCATLADPWGVTAGLGARFRYALLQAAKYGDPECRERLFAAVEAGVRGDPELWIADGGVCIPRATIG